MYKNKSFNPIWDGKIFINQLYKGISSKFLFYRDKDLYVNVLKYLLKYDKTLMISFFLCLFDHIDVLLVVL